MPSLRFDVFCRVVDNYGDAGVCWRLARQLVREHAVAATLWIDALASLARIAPGLDASRADQEHAGVRVRSLAALAGAVDLPDVVVEGFGCGLPDPYVEAMAAAARPPVWINLEYLSAEPWVEGAHGLPSPHPRMPLTRHFYFPGFTAGTGGLLREAGLLDARDAARAAPAGSESVWQALGIPPPAGDALVVSLFCYANPALPALLDLWAEGDEPVTCLVPEGVATAALDRWTGGAVPHAGQSLNRGRLALATVPFVAQDGYDRLLWRCDANFVRGEDSFVRAQWAARPFVWHIYPQTDDAHRAKLDAFLRRFEASLDAGAAAATTGFWHAWNDGDGPAAATAWPAFRAAFPALRAHGEAWARRLGALPDLATGLVELARARL
jgi:uncharacterized repeat protein (TIGR03837 family)